MKERDLLKNSIRQDMPDIEAVRNKCTDRSVQNNIIRFKTGKKQFVVPVAACILVLFFSLFLFNKTGYPALHVTSFSNSSLSDVSNGNSASDSSVIESAISPVVDEGDTLYIPSMSNLSRESPTYSTISELKAYAHFVFTGTCISSKPVFQNDTLYTLSTVKVTQVIKGPFAAGDTVSIVEMGGRTIYGEYAKNCTIEKKAFDTGTAERLPDDYKLVYGIDGYFALKEGDKVLCFAGDASGFLKNVSEPLYGIIGDYDGKFLLQEDGSYAKPVPSKTDKFIFNEKLSKITIKDLMSMQ